MRFMRNLMITMALVSATASVSFADSVEPIAASDASEVKAIEAAQESGMTEEEVDFILKAPETAMKIDNYVFNLRESGQFDGTLFVAQNNIILHRSGDYKALVDSVELDALYKDSKDKPSEENPIAHYQWINTIDGTSHSAELSTAENGLYALSKINFDNGITLVFLTQDQMAAHEALTKNLEYLVK